LAYAKSLGLKVHGDYKKAARVLGGVRAADCDTVFHFGRDGKPFYVQGNHSDDTARRVMDHLTRKLGQHGFNFLVEATTALSDTLEDRIEYFLREARTGPGRSRASYLKKIRDWQNIISM